MVEESRLELVYRVEVTDCLYVPAGRDSLLPNSIELRSIRCREREVVVPYVPPRYVSEALGLQGLKGVIITGLAPPCDIIESMIESKGFVELGDFLEYRDLRVIERVLGTSSTCPVVLVKRGVVLEGRILAEDACDALKHIDGVYKRLREGLVVGSLREAGCGYLRLVGVKLLLGGEEVGRDEVRRLCASG